MRAAALVLRVNSVARQVGGDHLDSNDGVLRRLDILKNYLASEAVGPIYREVACVLQYRRTAESIDEDIVEFDLLRHKAESKMEMGAGFPEALVPILCIRNAARSHEEQSSVLASTRRSPKFTDVAATMRRLFGSCGGAARHDILITEDAYGPLGIDKEQEARAT